MVVGGDWSYPPYEFIDRNGHPAGYNVELTRAIARVMGVEVEVRLGGWAEMRRALEEGSIDALEGMSYSDERARKVDFTPPHTIVHHSVFARAGSPPVTSLADLKGKEVLVLKGGIMNDYLLQQKVGATIIAVPNHADVLRQLAAGRHDYALMAKLPGLYLIRELGLSNLAPVGPPISSERYGFAVRQGDAELRSRFSEGLAILKNTGEYQQIYDRWLGVLEPRGITWYQAARYGAVVVVPLVLLLGGFALWSRTLHHQVAARTADLTREIAERTHAEEELRLHQQQLVQADKMAALGILVSGVAHEINNPNGLILLNMPVIRDAFADAAPILEEHYRSHGDFTLGGLRYSRMREEIPRMVEEMTDGARRVKRIVEDLKDFARQGDASLLECVDLNGVARAAVRLVDNLIRTSTTRFSVAYGDDLPPVRGNPQRIEQVVVNLVVNACQALPGPERRIALRTFVDPERDEVVLEVRDEGSGILPEHLSHLTDPFFTTKRESGGTGLGLAVSAGIVKEHGGRLDFDSLPGEGTTVRLVLPRGKECPT
ncbi:transporter substrate-binding domain-containing protein [Geobacter pickeringii]|uniref:transporter substrate-binding domain-containing protein n=1 Tax=Geobacter pickeringii TaxID=345632 RepID=UPI00068E1381|nr:transporter substrate-binding domain-containing protein [Geobacter pickeringii]